MTESIGAFLEELDDAFRQGWKRAEARHDFKRLWNAVRIRSSGWDQELAELQERYDALKRRHDASPLAGGECVHKMVIACLHEAFDARPGALPLDPIIDAITAATLELLSDEIFFGFPHIDWSVPLSLDEGMALKRYLDRKEQFLNRPLERVELWSRTVIALWSNLLETLPDTAFASEVTEDTLLSLSTSSIDLMHKPAEAIERMIVGLFNDDIAHAGLFETTRERFEANVCAVSGIPLEDRATSKRSLVLPTASDLATTPLVEMYLAGTAFARLFATDLPLTLPQQVRFEHCHILGGTGHGKTQLLQLLIRQDLDRVAAGEASVVVIDSQGDLIRTISRLDLFADSKLSDRLVLIDPHDIAHPAALNLFDTNRPRLQNCSAVEHEKLLNATIELYEYVFGELLGAELTQKQGVIFRYLARLMLDIPDATVQTLRELMEDGARFRPQMQKLSGTARHFFETEFFHPSFRATRQQILKRLWGVLSNPTFERMFSHPRNKVDLSELMNRGSVVLISTAKDLLKQEGSSILGRFFIAQIVQAATERAIIARSERMPTFVYIDEAADYLDHNVEHLLNQARKYSVGLTIAHQNLDQLSSSVRATVMASTSTKFAGGVSAKDARSLAEDMSCDADMLQAMRKRRDHTEFGAWIKNVTQRAVRVSVPLGAVDTLQTLFEHEYQDILEKNRERYCIAASEIDAHIERSRTASVSPPMIGSAPVAPIPGPDVAPEAIAPVEQPEPGSDPEVEVSLPVEPDVPAPPESTKKPSATGETRELGQGGQEHKRLQHLIKNAAQQNGWHAIIEEPISDDARVDVGLKRGGIKIACEISISTSKQHEMGNVEKCLCAGYDRIYLVALKEKRIAALKKTAAQRFSAQDLSRLTFFLPEDLVAHLKEPNAAPTTTESVSRGRKIKIVRGHPDAKQGKERRDAVGALIVQSIKRVKQES